ncbi:MAG: site-specific integrase [Defluviitaleaceae bacterium]|nr:site-specific integrase [Defluviitaleaceae bacterium]
MTGSLQIKGDTYYMVINTKNAEGNRKQKWISTKLSVKGNKRKAEHQLNVFLAECGEKGYSEPSKVLFCDYMVKWVELHRKNVQPKTHETNVFNLKKHVYPFFRETGLTLGNIKSETIQDYCDLKLSEGLNPNSVIRQYAMIRTALNHAYKSKLIKVNPCDWVDKPKSKRYVAEFYNADEIKRLLALFRGTSIEVPVFIAAYFGLRRSEAIGLQWSSLDLVNGTLTVRQKIVRVSLEGKCENIISNTLKTDSSYRTLLLALGYSMKEIQDWLGHSNYKTTADLYSHVDPRNKGKMIRGLTSALGEN